MSNAVDAPYNQIRGCWNRSKGTLNRDFCAGSEKTVSCKNFWRVSVYQSVSNHQDYKGRFKIHRLKIATWHFCASETDPDRHWNTAMNCVVNFLLTFSLFYGPFIISSFWLCLFQLSSRPSNDTILKSKTYPYQNSLRIIIMVELIPLVHLNLSLTLSLSLSPNIPIIYSSWVVLLRASSICRDLIN